VYQLSSHTSHTGISAPVDPTQTGTRSRRGLSFFATGLIGLMLAVGLASPAAAEEGYPTWDDVEAARANTDSKASEISRISGLIEGLAQETATANAISEQRANEYQEAQGKADEANLKLEELQGKVTEATIAAEASSKQVGQLVAMIARAGGSDLGLQLFLETQDPDDMLYQLGSMTKATETANTLYEQAATDQNAVQALVDQSEVVTQERTELAETAQGAFEIATEAAAAAEAALVEQQNNEGVLRAQLAVLIEDRAVTEADYNTGEQIRVAREAAEAAAAAELARQVAEAEAAAVAQAAQQAAADAAARAAAEAQAAADRAAQEAARPAPVTSSPSVPAPTVPRPAPAPVVVAPVSSGGWSNPSAGYISSGYGPRLQRPVPGVGAFHYGTDIASSCGTSIRAANSGTVVASTWLGTYGNWILIDHGNGVQTGYAHIQNGGRLVGVGAQVSAGQTIALMGTTGASSGCHLHFEVRQNGARINPVPFMAARGVGLG
jgi:murein DD-endopeptidase MepM/ murein hydrolase activator NlpD